MAGQLTIDTLKASSGVLATQNGMTGIAKAWVNFAGSSGSINGSFNVSSVTRSATGAYTVNFTTAMPNANYCLVGGGLPAADTPLIVYQQYGTTNTTSACYPRTANTVPSAVDPVSVYVAILGS